MDEQPGQNDASALTQLVGQFRRLARLVAADPLRMFPAALEPARASLGTPLQALIDFAPLQRLVPSVIANVQTTDSGNRPRAQPLARGDIGDGRRGKVSLALAEDASRRQAAANKELAPAGVAARIGQSTSAGVGTTARLVSSERAGKNAGKGLTLAERRMAVRKAPGNVSSNVSSNASTQASTLSGPVIASPNTSTGVPRTTAPPAKATGANARAAVVDVAMAAARAARSILTPLASLGGVDLTPKSDGAVSQILQPITDLVDKIRAASAVKTLHDAPLPRDAATVRSGQVPALADRDNAVSSAVSKPNTKAATRTNASVPGEARQGEQGRPTASDSNAFADDLFEALYRDGVDLSWP